MEKEVARDRDVDAENNLREDDHEVTGNLVSLHHFSCVLLEKSFGPKGVSALRIVRARAAGG